MNEHYVGLLLCPECRKVYVTCSHDLQGHRRVCLGGWHRSRFGDGEIKHAGLDETLAQELKRQGHLRIGNFEYSLSGNQEWIKRRLASE